MWSRWLDYPISFKSAFAIVMANDIGAAITPTAVGGGPVKIGMLVNKGMPAPKATFMVLLSATEDIIFYGTGIVLTLLYMHHVIEQLGAYLLKHSSLLIGLSIFLLAIILGWKTVKLIIKKYCRIFQKVGSCDYPDLTLACGIIFLTLDRPIWMLLKQENGGLQ